MGTPFSDVFKLFLGSIQDYRIKKIFETQPVIAEDMIETFLLRALPLFKNCTKDLTPLDMVNKCFPSALNMYEISIISNLTLNKWLDWDINNVTQTNLILDSGDYKRHAESPLFKAKCEYRDMLREQVEQEMVDYGLMNTPWKDWAVGNYEL